MVVGLSSFREVNDNEVADESADGGGAMAKALTENDKRNLNRTAFFVSAAPARNCWTMICKST